MIEVTTVQLANIDLQSELHAANTCLFIPNRCLFILRCEMPIVNH
jgi:hypothetical protein